MYPALHLRDHYEERSRRCFSSLPKWFSFYFKRILNKKTIFSAFLFFFFFIKEIYNMKYSKILRL